MEGVVGQQKGMMVEDVVRMWYHITLICGV